MGGKLHFKHKSLHQCCHSHDKEESTQVQCGLVIHQGFSGVQSHVACN